MTDLVSTISTAIGISKRLREISKNVANAEFASALADLTLELSELKLKAAALMEENDQLRRAVSKRATKQLQYRDFAYFDADNAGPYCPGCYDNNEKTVRLTPTPRDFHELASHTCPVCQQAFGGPQ